MAKILIVDDEEKIRAILEIILTGAGHQVVEARDGVAALQALSADAFDLVLSDVRMDGMGGFDLLAAIREKELGCPVVFITAYATLDSAIQALRLGAADYLVKPFEQKNVLMAVERALGMRRLMAENLRLKKEVADSRSESAGLFVSPQMQKVRAMAAKVAQSDATVLLSGESGTGKEVVARFIHQASARRQGRFVALNCAAIAPNLLEAELFGHEKGAFTGADRARPGKFEYAAAGTLFLDEIGEMPLDAQVKLLRTIQEKSVQRVGGNQEIPLDCRLICATNRDLAERVRKGVFREDLFYRLAVFPIELPPLRARCEDIVPLVEFCLAKSGRPFAPGEAVTPAARQLLQSYPWPGNVRELFNVVERALILKDGDGPLTSDDFPHLDRPNTAQAPADQLFRLPPTGVDYDELQRAIVLQALEKAMGNQSAAARLLRVSRAKFRTLHSLLSEDPRAHKILIRYRGKK